METIKYKDWSFEVDVARNKAVYQRETEGSTDRCSCLYCKNFLTQKTQLYPAIFQTFLNSVGIDPKKEVEVYYLCLLENGKHLYGGWFHFKGHGSSHSFPIVQDSKAPIQLSFTKNAALSFFDPKECKDLIQVEFLLSLDWVLPKKTS